MTRGGERGGALRGGGRATLSIDARVIKTLGDEVMVVASDSSALTDGPSTSSPGPRTPPPRIGVHYGEAIYRDGDYYGREINKAARVVRAPPAGRCW